MQIVSGVSLKQMVSLHAPVLIARAHNSNPQGIHFVSCLAFISGPAHPLCACADHAHPSRWEQDGVQLRGDDDDDERGSSPPLSHFPSLPGSPGRDSNRSLPKQETHPQENRRIPRHLPAIPTSETSRDGHVTKVFSFQNRLWQRDRRDMPVIQPDSTYYNDVPVPAGLSDYPVNVVTTKFVKACTNKTRSPIFCTSVSFGRGVVLPWLRGVSTRSGYRMGGDQ